MNKGQFQKGHKGYWVGKQRSQVTKELMKKGFEAAPTHFSSKAVKTNASASVIKEVITKLSGSGRSKKTI